MNKDLPELADEVKDEIKERVRQHIAGLPEHVRQAIEEGLDKLGLQLEDYIALKLEIDDAASRTVANIIDRVKDIPGNVDRAALISHAMGSLAQALMSFLDMLEDGLDKELGLLDGFTLGMQVAAVAIARRRGLGDQIMEDGQLGELARQMDNLGAADPNAGDIPEGMAMVSPAAPEDLGEACIVDEVDALDDFLGIK